MFSDKEVQGRVVSVSGNKVSVSPDMPDFSHLAGNLPPEAAALLAMMQGNAPLPTTSPAANTEQEVNKIFAQMESLNSDPANRKISDTNPDLRSIVENEINAQQAPESQELVRARSVEMQVAYERQQALEEIKNATDLRKKFTIYECGIALGIIVGSSTRNEVAEIMAAFSKVVCPPDDNDLMFFYSDIHVTVFYNDDMVVRELQFGDYYRGETSKGLKLGDPLEKAFELYGQPRMKSPRGAIWNKFGVFCQNNFVSSVRIQA